MSVISVRDGPSLPAMIAFLAGERIVKSSGDATPAYNLAGTLYLDSGGWLLLSVPAAFVRGVFSAMSEPGLELPPSTTRDTLQAHISVMTKEEVALIGGGEKITERGKQFRYSLGRLKSVKPDGWANVEKAFFVTVHSPALQQLRRSYGLSSLPHNGEYDFHITCGVVRRGVLARNDTAKT